MDATFPLPTSSLPPIARISSFDPTALSSALQYLRAIYLPSVRGSRRRRPTLGRYETSSYFYDPPSSVTRSSNEVFSLESLRSDAFERSYAMRWLTALVSKLQTKIHNVVDDDGTSESLKADYDRLINDAASLVAACAGTASAGTLTRTFTFTSALHDGPSSTSCVKYEVTVQLTDRPLENADYASVGAQTWGGACVLSEDIVERPQEFGLACQMTRPLRILELGAGTGLVSIVIGKLLSRMGIDATIVASDFHPLVLTNLAANISSNFQTSLDFCEPHRNTAQSVGHRGISITSAFLDWSKLASLPADKKAEQPFADRFDLIFGADIIYEEKHAEWIKACLQRLLRKPSRAADGGSHSSVVRHNFHLVIPLRPTHTAESDTVQSVFERRDMVENRRASAGEDVQAMDPVLCIHRSDTIVCDAEHTGDGKEGEEVLYAYYQIGWF